MHILKKEICYAASRRYIVSIDHHFQHIIRQICELVECNSAHLLLGCSELELRHPLLDLYSATPTTYSVIASCGPSSSDSTLLLQSEQILALCDSAMQTGHIQSINQLQAYTPQNTAIQSICIVPLERPAGMLGLLILTNTYPGAFYAGERLLLKHYLPPVVQQLERDLRSLNPAKATQATLPLQPQSKELGSLKHEFISMISHELRTPLSAIKGYAVLLQAYGAAGCRHEDGEAEISPARQHEYLDIIMQQTSHLEVLISDLLDISCIHSGRL